MTVFRPTPATDELIRRVIEREGGVKDVGDGKGVTRWGQTPGWLAEFNLPIPTDVIGAADNYLAWLHLTGLIHVVGATVDLFADFVIDFAVHSGHVPVVKVLQGLAGVKADGRVGPVTTKALVRLVSGRVGLAVKVLSAEIRYQGRLLEKHPERHAKFAHGWANRNADKLLRLTGPGGPLEGL
jgi:hypothetical protein